MSYFLVIGVDRKATDCTGHFADSIALTRISNSSIIESVIGGTLNADVFLTTMYGDSHELLDKGDPKRNCSAAFIDGVGSILTEAKSVSVLLHWYRGHVEFETLPSCPKRKISLRKFTQLYPNIEEDVRYVVVAE